MFLRSSSPGSIWGLFLPLALCTAATHGFGYFLFPALLPAIRAEHSLTYSTTANIAAVAQVAYVVGSLFAGTFGPALGAGRLTLVSVGITALGLLALSAVSSGWWIGAFVALMSAAAAVNWASISALAGVYVESKRRGRVLTVAATGSAWGVCANGVLVSEGLPILKSGGVWLISGLITAVIVLATGLALFRRGALGDPKLTIVRTVETEDSVTNRGVTLRQPAVFFVGSLSVLAGLSTIPYLTYLGAYLETEMGNPSTLVGSVWTILGITGALTGFVVGMIADRYGLTLALRVIFLAFIASAVILAAAPEPPIIYGAGIGFGLMYFTLWGLISTYVNQFLPPGPAMRVIGFSLVCVGLAAALGNWMAGQWAEYGHSFADVYVVVACICGVMVVATFAMPTKRGGDAL